MKKISVLVIEDNSVTSDLLVTKLNQTPEITAESFTSVETAMTKISSKPDFILLDNFLDGVNGIDTIPKIKSISPNSKIIVLSNQNKEENVKNALSNGATACFKKDGEGIITAIKSITGAVSK